MARKVHSSLHPSPVQSARVSSEVRRYEILTPMVGGGIKSFQTDMHFPIRPTALRGILRYWWRATRGWQSKGNIHRLRELEATIWGGSYKGPDGKVVIVSSPISLDVVVTQQGHDIRANDPDSKITGDPSHSAPIGDKKGRSRFSYVLFPLREPKESNASNVFPVVAKSLLKFELRLTYSLVPNVNMKDEIDAALWAWELFGGVGARTRRGCGSIQSLDNTKRIEDLIQEGIQRFLSGSNSGAWPAHVPNLQGLTATQVYQPGRASVAWRRMQYQNAVDAWLNLVDIFKLQIRQARNTTGTKNNIGSSKWFEANALRKIYANQRQMPQFQNGNSPTAQQLIFSRLQLGAPMELSFINPNHFRKGDSKDYKFMVSVDDANELRVPSPLIFRVWRSPNGSMHQVVLVMGGLRTPDEAIVQSAQLREPKSVKTRGVGDVELLNRRRADLNDVLRIAFEILKGNQQ